MSMVVFFFFFFFLNFKFLILFGHPRLKGILIILQFLGVDLISGSWSLFY